MSTAIYGLDKLTVPRILIEARDNMALNLTVT
jgi:hypothetical protein